MNLVTRLFNKRLLPFVGPLLLIALWQLMISAQWVKPVLLPPPGDTLAHLAHNFLMAVLGKQPAFPDAPTSANWTLVGICALESALKGGEKVLIPMF